MGKKTLAILMILLLSFSNAAFGALGPIKPKPTTDGKKTLAADETEYDANDKVRIIVEVEGETAIEYATKKNTRYKDLSGSAKEDLQSDAVEAQNQVKKQIEDSKVDAEYINSFTTVLNGFSAEVKYEEIERIKKLKDVEGVHIVHEYKRPEIKPDMKYSKDIVEAQDAWRDYGYKGQGMVVGVIDTGIDYNHRDMVLSEDTKVDLTKEKVGSLVSEHDLPGKFYTDKVPYGYNYMDQNSEIRDLGAAASMHGMHVSGTVGANGDEENGGIKGVAPEAQILGLKVFGNDPEMPSTWSDIYVKAIDDAILLGADVLNMSLGSTAAFVAPEDPEQKAVERAVENGVLMSISAGNSAHYGNGYWNPLSSNPDIGVVGSPGISTNSLQVASLENTTITVDAMDVYLDGEAYKTVGYQKQDTPDFLDLFKGEKKEVVYVGTGEPENYEGKDVEGKIVFAVRTGGFFYAQIEATAIENGAAGVIVRGAESHGDYVNMAIDAHSIPMVSLSVSEGTDLKEKVEAGQSMEVVFTGDMVAAANPMEDKMSNFTSWGVTPNLDFKPEITAPGGKIYSTLNDDTYGNMSGTSMAAPHVAGGAALVLQRVDEQFDLTGSDRVNMAKNLLMNTAEPVIDKSPVNETFGWSNPYSPRRQGAGIMQLHGALSTPVVVTEVNSGLGKASLKEVGDQFTFSVNVENFSDEAVSYDVGANVQTDFANSGFLGYSGTLELEPQAIEDTDVLISKDGEEITSLEVGANSTVKVDVSVDLTNAKVLGDDLATLVGADSMFPNGYFVEGFLTLSNDGQHELSLPYVGFKGDWTQAPILDEHLSDEVNTYYGATGMAAMLSGDWDFLGYDQFEDAYSKDLAAFSPNGDGYADSAFPVVSFLRNAKKVQYNVLDREGNVLRTLRNENNIRKNYYDGGAAAPYYVKSASAWDGNINLKPAAEGEYYYEVKALLDYPGAEWQSFKFPIELDVTAPAMDVTYNEEDNALAFSDVVEEGSGVASIEVKVNGETVKTLAGDSTAYSFETKASERNYVDVVAVDYAGNKTTIRVADSGESDIPDIHWITPEALGVVDTLTPSVSGYINEKSGVKELLIDGKKVDVVFNEKENRYDFSTTLSFENDGVKNVDVTVTDGNDNKIDFQRRFFVDSTAPTLTVKNVPASVGHSKDSIKVNVEVEDNFDEIRLYQNDNEIFYNELVEPYEMKGFKKSIETELQLVEGDNKFVFSVTDLAGHETTKEITIKKQGEVEPDPVEPDPDPTPDPEPAPEDGVVDGDEMEKAIKDASGDSVKLEVDSKAITLKKEAVAKAADSKKNLVLDGKGVTVELPKKVVADLGDVSKDVKISLVEADKSKVELKDNQTLRSSVYDIQVSYVEDGKETAVTTFAAPVKVTFAINGDKVNDKRKTAAFYHNEDADKWEYVGGKVNGDHFTFETSHFSTYAVIENDFTFSDVKKHWAKDEIEVLASRKITSGKSETTFAPQQDLTRAEFAVLLSRTLRLPTESYEGIFKDVKESKEWAYAGVEAAYRAGIVKGNLDGTFSPDAKITREEMALMIVRAVGYQDETLLEGMEPSNKFKDDRHIGAFAKEAVYLANELGIIKGRADNSFDPKVHTTRAETAVMLYRMLNVLDEM
ncbi:S8 family serine peptidase [Rossellomorea oryzaecorticis]|uniref:S8 family serine peptidase n=1 Tax=Rossellomorea oryzaecorticis TaxID=1396505 RepID=A0ABW8VSP2_9BACI